MPETFPTYQEALDYLFKATNYEKMTTVRYNTTTFDLGRMEELLARVGNPHVGLRAVHITGTKGKGSTATMIAEIATAAGLKVGLYTSPHLLELEERIAIGGKDIPREDLRELINLLYPHVEHMKKGSSGSAPTFFEIMTCLALVYCRRQEVDLAVLEVGLGGRLDATNVITPLVSVITPVSFDHTLQLGSTLSKIAWEKAGIIKPGIPVVSSPQRGDAWEVIEEVAQKRSAPLYLVSRDFHIDDVEMLPLPQVGSRFSLATWAGKLPDLEISLVGRHQIANAATAVGAVEVLREQEAVEISDDHIRRGLRAARVSARVEVISTSPLIVLDGAHNVASVRALNTALEDYFPPRRRVLLFAIAKDKDVEGVLNEIVPLAQEIVLTVTGSPRAADPEDLVEKCKAVTSAPVRTEPDISRAFALARSLVGENEMLVITGSLYLAGEVKRLLE